MKRNLFYYGFFGLVSLAWNGIAWADDTILPAGTLLRCTLDEPNFSSKTAEDGDPVLCRTNALVQFGRASFPRGAYLGGRLADHKDPGHFFGKGALRLEFDHIGLPGTDVPLSGKIIAVRGFRVDRKGDIVGRGHATRDAVEWAFPPLWPWKVLSLPARGPLPTLKGEVPVTVRLMEPVVVPDTSESSRPGFDKRPASSVLPQSFPNKPIRSAVTYRASGVPEAERQFTGVDERQLSVAEPNSSPGAQPIPLTLLVFRNETIYGARDYWIDDGRLNYILSNGSQRTVELSDIDWGRTAALNAERGVRVKLRTGRDVN